MLEGQLSADPYGRLFLGHADDLRATDAFSEEVRHYLVAYSHFHFLTHPRLRHLLHPRLHLDHFHALVRLADAEEQETLQLSSEDRFGESL